MTVQAKPTAEELDAFARHRDHYIRFVRQLLPHPKDMAQAFDTYALLPENEDRILELINGEIVEKVPTNARASQVSGNIVFWIKHYLREQRIKGHVTTADGGFKIGTERYAPDVAYLPAEKQEQLEGKGYNSVPPDLAVEVETNITTDSTDKLRKKTAAYLDHGLTLWVVYPEKEEIKVHAPGKDVVTLGMNDVLDGGDVLPGFSVPVRDIFEHG